MTAPDARDVVFLLDVDDTLLNNDAVIDDLRRHLSQTVGATCQEDYWRQFEALRSELGYADYLGALQRYRLEHPYDSDVLRISLFLLDYPFTRRLYPEALDVVTRLSRKGPVVILSDGDAVFQPLKIARSGLWAAVEGRVLVYIHKERMLDDVALRFPATRYVMVDDKLRILATIKAAWGNRVTTVFVRQGHYAMDPKIVEAWPAADVTIERIADLPRAVDC